MKAKEEIFLFIQSLFTLFPRPQAEEKEATRKKWKQFLSQLCYCLQNIFEKEIFISSKAAFFPSSVWLSVLVFFLTEALINSFSSSLLLFFRCAQDKLLEKYLFSPSIDTHAVHFFAVVSLLLFYFVNIFVDSFFLSLSLFGRFLWEVLKETWDDSRHGFRYL